MIYKRMPIELESPESLGYDAIKCNLAESSVRDLTMKKLGLNLHDLVLQYGDHQGKPALRELIASQYPGLKASDVLLTIGAAGALFIIHTALLREQDHLIVLRPNYATNIETPRGIGCQISFIDLCFEEQFSLNLELVKEAIRPNTKLISITTPHNPTGTMISQEAVGELARLAATMGCYLLVDETYRDISFKAPIPLAATLGKQAISVSSVSKAYGIPGIRIGWIINQDPHLQELFLAAKEQIHICNSMVDEEICHQGILKKESYFPAILEEVSTNFRLLKEWISNHPYLEWVEPSGGVVCFPRFKTGIPIDYPDFYENLLKEWQTYVGPGHWFDQGDQHFRLGFGWEDRLVFRKGLENIDQAIQHGLKA